VAWRESSVVDITWATSELYPKIRDWRVAEGVETLSVHFYIVMEVVSEDVDKNNNRVARGGASRSGPSQPPRRRLKERDTELLRAAAIVSAWSWDARGTTSLGSVDEEAEILQRYMSAACDASMSRSVPGGGRNRCVSWWTPEIAELWASCVQARRRFLRARRRRRMRDEEEISRCYGFYREARRTLQRENKIAKARSWKELIEAVESDPWGRPYKVVTRKLRPAASPQTANMDPVLLANVIGTLFPRHDSDAGLSGSSLCSGNDETASTATAATTSTERSEELRVTQEELLAATKNMASHDVALGPDGVPGRVWAETMEAVAPRVRHQFTRCLREGIYAQMWRTARLVQLRRDGRPPDSPSAYRPICLLDEIGKLFERVIAASLEAHISGREPGWHDSQYGYRRGRSTVDAA
jgi:hypothetical protein